MYVLVVENIRMGVHVMEALRGQYHPHVVTQVEKRHRFQKELLTAHHIRIEYNHDFTLTNPVRLDIPVYQIAHAVIQVARLAVHFSFRAHSARYVNYVARRLCLYPFSLLRVLSVIAYVHAFSAAERHWRHVRRLRRALDDFERFRIARNKDANVVLLPCRRDSAHLVHFRELISRRLDYSYSVDNHR